MTTALHVRTGELRDLDRLVAFNLAMARETEDKELDPDVLRRGVRRLLEDSTRGFYLVAARDGEVVGSLMVTREWSDWRDGEFWWVQSVYVRPKARRQGVYRRLYRQVKALAAEQDDVCGFRLYVEQDNRVAQQAYRALGMTCTPYLLFEELSAPRNGSSTEAPAG